MIELEVVVGLEPARLGAHLEQGERGVSSIQIWQRLQDAGRARELGEVGVAQRALAHPVAVHPRLGA